MATLLWQPSQARIESTNLFRFMQNVNKSFGTDFCEYPLLYRWSIDHIPDFWSLLWEFAGVIASAPGEEVVDDLSRMPGAKWFPGARLNFAENLLRHRDGRTALIFKGEGRAPVRMTYAELYDEVARVAFSLKLETRADGTIKVDGGLATSLPGVFAAGDVVSGPKTIIDAIAQGRMASVAIDRHLGGQGRIQPEPAADRSPALPRAAPAALRRASAAKSPPRARIAGFEPVESGLEEAAAVAEAGRCLACDARRFLPRVDPALCKGCGYCREICGLDVFRVADGFTGAGSRPYAACNPQHCVGCLKCVFICPDLAITLEEG